LRWYTGVAPTGYASLWFYDAGVLQWQVDFQELDPPGEANYGNVIVRDSDVWVSATTPNESSGSSTYSSVVYRFDITDGSLLGYWVKEDSIIPPQVVKDDLTDDVWVLARTYGENPRVYRLNNDCSEAAESDETPTGGLGYDASMQKDNWISASGGYLYCPYPYSDIGFHKFDSSAIEIDADNAISGSPVGVAAGGGKLWGVTIAAGPTDRYYLYETPIVSSALIFTLTSLVYHNVPLHWSYNGEKMLWYAPHVAGFNSFRLLDNTGTVVFTSDRAGDINWTAAIISGDLVCGTFEKDDVNECRVYDAGDHSELDSFMMEHKAPRRVAINGDAIAMLTLRVLIP
jgi:hypothetical protein